MLREDSSVASDTVRFFPTMLLAWTKSGGLAAATAAMGGARIFLPLEVAVHVAAHISMLATAGIRVLAAMRFLLEEDSQPDEATEQQSLDDDGGGWRAVTESRYIRRRRGGPVLASLTRRLPEVEPAEGAEVEVAADGAGGRSPPTANDGGTVPVAVLIRCLNRIIIALWESQK